MSDTVSVDQAPVFPIFVLARKDAPSSFPIESGSESLTENEVDKKRLIFY